MLTITKRQILITALTLVAGWGGTAFVKARPEYSLWQLQRAVQQHDLEKFNRYVDTEAITEDVMQAAQEAMQTEMAKMPVPTDVWSQAGYEIGKGLAEGLLAVLKPGLKKILDDGIKNNLLNLDGKHADPGGFILHKLTVSGALAFATVEEVNTKTTLTFRMQQQPNGEWKIVGFGAETAKALLKQAGVGGLE